MNLLSVWNEIAESGGSSSIFFFNDDLILSFFFDFIVDLVLFG
jgi:hypothetical protein